MHETQKRYAEAKARKDHLEAAFDAVKPADPADDAGETEVEAWAKLYTDLRTRMGLDAAEVELEASRVAMVDWALGNRQIKALAQRAGLDLTDLARRAARNIKICNQLTDICFRFSGR